MSSGALSPRRLTRLQDRRRDKLGEFAGDLGGGGEAKALKTISRQYFYAPISY